MIADGLSGRKYLPLLSNELFPCEDVHRAFLVAFNCHYFMFSNFWSQVHTTTSNKLQLVWLLIVLVQIVNKDSYSNLECALCKIKCL